MATVTGYTAARMKEIEDKAITGGAVVSGNLILYPKNYPTESSVNAGPVVGPAGPTGPAGAVSTADLNSAIATLNAKLGTPLGVMNKKDQSAGWPAGFQTIPPTAHTTITFPDADLWDNGAFHELSIENRKFTVPAGGKGIYQVNYNGYFAITGSPGGTRFISILKNGLTDAVSRIEAHQVDYGATGHTTISMTGHYKLIPGDYLAFSAYQTTGAAQTFTANVCIRWVSDY